MRNNFKEEVASELRSLRAKNNLTQKEVANIAKIDVMTITRYENNSTSMQLDMIEKIIEVYKVEPAIFFGIVSANMQKSNISKEDTSIERDE